MTHFNVESAVNAWAELALKEHCIAKEDMDELKDHLLCEIESRIEQGMSETTAFSCAVDSLKDHPLLKDNYKVKNPIFNKLIELECRGSENKTQYQRGKIIVVQSLMWAGAMLATALMVGDHPNAGNLSIIVFVPLATMSILMLQKQLKDS